jgi:hypothetical protein
MKTAHTVVSLPRKTLALLLVFVCLAAGVAGLVLPVIPGLLLLAVAALIAARHFPSVDTRLRRHRAIGRHMDRADGFLQLRFGQQLQMAGWSFAKLLQGGIAALRSWPSKARY